MTDFTHPSLDDLADLHEGILADAAAHEISAHLTVCGACTAAMAALDEVEAMLVSAGSTPAPMPTSVADGLEESLRRASRERATGVASLAGHRTSSEPASAAAPARPRWILVGAAAASTVVLGYAAVSLFHSPGGSSESTAGSGTSDHLDAAGTSPSSDFSAARKPKRTTMNATGQSAARQLVTRKTLPKYAKTLAALPSATDSVTARCAAVRLTGGIDATTVRWRGAPAVVVVDPASRRVSVYDCAAGGARLYTTSY